MNEFHWSIASLKEYVDAVLLEREKRRDEQNKATLLALAKAEAALEHRLELLNEFRNQSTMEQANFVSRSEFDALERRYEERHAQLATEVKLLQTRVNPMLWIGSIITVTVLGTFISHIVTGTP